MPHMTAFDDLASLDPLSPQSEASSSSKSNAPSNTFLTMNPSTPTVRADDIETFGPLFGPSAPPPLPEAGETSTMQSQRKESHLHRRAPSTSSQTSDFGAFVSVSAFDDPLSGDVIAGEFDDTFEDATEDVQADTSRPRSRSRSRSTTRSSTNSNAISNANANPTLSFFDQFASDARERSSATRNLVLDELLLHQDDPMYFLAEGAISYLPKTPATSSTITQQQQQTPLAVTPAPLSPPPPMPPPKSPRHASKPGTPQPLPPPVPKLPSAPGAVSSTTPSAPTRFDATLVGTDSQQRIPVLTPNYMDPAFDLHEDVDHSYFSIPSPVPPPLSEDDGHIIDLTPNRAGRPTRTLNPRRSQSLLVPEPRLAAPVTSPEGALRSLDESPEITQILRNDFYTTSPPPFGSLPSQSHPEESTSPPRPTGMTRSPSSTSLSSSLSALPGAKWMSTLLRGSSSDAPQQHHSGQARPALESIFSHDEQAQREHGYVQSHLAQSAAPAKQVRGANHDEENAAHVQPSTSYHSHGWRQSFAPQHAQTMHTQSVTFTHGSAFAPKPTTPGTSFSSPNYLGTVGVGGGVGGGSTSGISISSTASPFAPTVYVPPSGAPGFMGEGYSWDKGFSDELEQERRQELKSGQSVLGQAVPPTVSTSAPKSVAMRGSSESLESGASGSRDEPERHLPPQDMSDNLSVKPDRKKRVEKYSGLGTARDLGPFSQVSKVKGKGTDGGWGSTLFGFGTMRSKTGVFSPPRSSLPPSHDMRGASASEGDLRRYGSPRGVEESEDNSGMGDFIERRAGNVELVGRKASSSPVLTSELASQIRSNLPALSRLPKKWTLVYSLDQDGISLNTLYTRSEAHATRRPAPGEVLANNAAMLLVVKDADGAIFGAWLAEGIRYIKGGKGYYGGGESFLWKFTNDTLKVFKTTGKNKYIALCEPDFISCGGGDGHYGFYLDSSLFDGSSAPCPTFDNEPLCSPGTKKGASVTFECVGLEVWGMG